MVKALSLRLTLSIILICTAYCASSFPNNFAWGVASAAYQIEGGWNASDKGQSIWDVFSHIPGTISDNTTGDVALDFFNRYTEDINLMASMGIKNFRMSLSWPRILPNGTVNLTSPDFDGYSADGVKFYNGVINALLAANITPWVTLYHWDLPAALNDNTTTGGWLNPNITTLFNDYADFCFQTFGDRVKNWLTFNEISTYAGQGYGSGVHAPGRCGEDRCKNLGGLGDPGSEPYIVAHNSLIAHALAVNTYRQKYQSLDNGQIGLTINSAWGLPWNPNDPQDVTAAENSRIFEFGWYADPIITGDYPDIMKQYIGSRLPTFNATEQGWLKGSYDFIGINYYTSSFIQHVDTPGTNWTTDSRSRQSTTDVYGNLIGPTADSTWLHIYARGLRSLINWINNRYSVNSTQTPFYIFENGVSCPGENNLTVDKARNDTCRVSFIRDHLTNVVETIIRDNINVMGYFSWSIFDNYEWASGFSVRFGMVYIDYVNNLTRLPKASAGYYQNVIANLTGGQNLTRAIEILDTPSSFNITIDA